MKRPFETIKELVFESLDKHKENQRLNFSNFDSYMVWVVGFSIGGVSIIVTNLTQFNQTFSYCIVKVILTLLALSIISGMLYRLAFYLWQIQYQSIEFYLQAAFSNKEIMLLDLDGLQEVEDINEVIRRFKSDFGEDISHLLPIYEKLDETQKLYFLNYLKGYYENIRVWAKTDFNLAIDYVKNTFKDAFGLSDKRIDKLFTSKPTGKLKFYGYVTALMFLLSCLSFIAVVIILCAAY